MGLASDQGLVMNHACGDGDGQLKMHLCQNGLGYMCELNRANVSATKKAEK